MKSNNKFSIDLDIEDLLGLKDNKNTLEYDLNFIIDNGIDEYLKQQQEHEKKKQDFIVLFKECYDDIVIKYNSNVYNSETGKWDDAQYKLNDVPEVIPNDGYLSGVWEVDINNDTIVKDDVVYTCTCVYDYKFTKQPTIKKQDAFGMFEIEWETNFTPVKIEIYDKTDGRLIGVVDDPSALTTTENLEEGERIDYYLRAYYDDSHYIDSDSIILKRYILLPATGDTGIIFYMVFGLLIILYASIFFMTYRMNYSNNM